MKLLFYYGFSALGTNIFALDFTLESQGDRFDNIYPFVNAPDLVARNGPYQYFLGQVGPNHPPSATVQWMTFDIITTNLWIPENHVSHLVFATRGNGDLNPQSYLFRTLGGQFKGVFAASEGYRQANPGEYNEQAINCHTNSRMYWEFRFPNMTPYQSSYKGYLPANASPGNPYGFPSGFFVKCSDFPGPEGSKGRFLEDGVEYSVTIHSAPGGMRYWIYPKRNGAYLPVWYDNIADDGFPANYQEGIGDFYNQYVFIYSLTYLPGWYTYSRSEKKGGVVAMRDVKNDPYASTYVNMQNANTMIGIYPVANGKFSQKNPWKITIKNFSSGWF